MGIKGHFASAATKW